MSFSASLDDIVETNANGLLSKHPTWERIRLSEVATVLNGFAFSSAQFSKSDGVPLLRIRDILQGSTETFYSGEFSPEYMVHPGELVVGMDGDFNSALWHGPEVLLNQRVCKLTPDPDFYSLRLLTLLLPGYLRAINAETSSITVKHLSSRTIEDIPLPLPPYNEQQRIVDELEALFTDLDAAVAALKRVQANLKRYRASVLKAACEGRLVPTEAELARKEGRTYETGEQLLARILQERRAKWESDQLTNLLAAGKPTENDDWKKKYKEPIPPDTSNLPELPEGWTWASLNQLGEVNRGKSKHRPRNDPKLMGGPYPFVQTGDVKHSRGFIRQHTQTYSEFGLAQSRLWPEGTLCITIAANIADTGILTYPACFPDSVVGFIPQYELLARFVQLFMATAKENLERYAPATAQKNINLEILSDVAVPLPPQAEQVRIVNEAEQNLAAADDAAAATDRETRRSDRLRQAILKRAFEGKLVPQDPNDEPAPVLLDRIRAQRAATPAPSREAGNGRRGVKAMAKEHKGVRRSVVQVLKDTKSAMSPESLFTESGNTPDTIEEFYAELKAGIDSQEIEQLRPDSVSVLLRAKQS